MRALIIAQHEKTAADIAETLRRSALGYDEIDVAGAANAVASVGRHQPELIVAVLCAQVAALLPAVHEVRSLEHSSLLVIGPTDDAKLVLGVLRQGADEYVDQSDVQSELEARVRNLRMRHPVRVERGRIVGVLGASGGAGASTVAVNLAVSLAQRHGEVSLIDMQANVANLDLLLDLKPVHHLADVCHNAGRLDPTMFQQSLVRHPSGIHLLAAEGVPDVGQDITPQAVRKVLAMARAMFPHVVLDLDRSLQAEQLIAAAQTDLLLLVLRLDITSLRNARRMLERINKLGIGEDRVWAVANRYGQSNALPLGKFEHALGMPVTRCVVDDPAAMNRAGNTGVPVVLDRPRAKASKQLARLAVEIAAFQPLHHRNGRATGQPSASGASRNLSL